MNNEKLEEKKRADFFLFHAQLIMREMYHIALKKKQLTLTKHKRIRGDIFNKIFYKE